MREPGGRPGATGFARLFTCFAPGARSVSGEPAVVSSRGSKRASSSTGRRRGAATASAAPLAARAPRPPSPTAADPLAAYLGHQTAPSALFAAQESACDSIAQTSTYATPSGSGSSGGASGGISVCPDPYDADADSPRYSFEGSPGSAGARCFRPAVRHSRPGAEGAAADGGPAGEEAGVQEIVAAFERLSISSATSSAARDVHGSSSSAASPAAQRMPGGGTTCASELHAAPPSQPHSQPPSRSGSSRSRGSSVSLAASGSVSLAHFLAAGSSSARSLGSISRKSSARSVRRLGSVTQVVVPDSPAHATAGQRSASANSAAAETAAAGCSGAGTAGGARGEQARGSGGGGAPEGPAVQQRLTELHGYHFVSLQRIRSQAGDFQGE